MSLEKKLCQLALLGIVLTSVITPLSAKDYLSSNRFVLDNDALYYSAGNLGMGTTTPLGALDIAKTNTSVYLLNIINEQTTSIDFKGFSFYAGNMNELENGVLSLRGISSAGVSINMLTLASKNIGIGSFSEPLNGDFGVLPDKGLLHVSGNVYVGGEYTPGAGLSGTIQKPDGSGATFLTPTGEEISFGYDETVTSNPKFKILVDGQALHFTSGNSQPKTFVIPHPNNPSLYLVHAMQELPEATVQYVGSAKLKKGQAVVTLPGYFEALTHQEGRHIRLSTIDGFDILKIKARSNQKIHKGQFVVIANNPESEQAFDWEVTAVRKDVSPLNPTPLKTRVQIKGRAPYTYIESSL